MTLKDVAKKAGVCLVTASRAMNDHPSVRPKMRQKVLAAAKEINYTPNLLAKALVGNSADIVSILVSKLFNPYFGMLTEKISLGLNRHGICSVLCDTPEKNSKLVKSLSTRGTFMISNIDPGLIREMATRHPTVGINCIIPEDVDMTSIAFDFEGAYSLLANAALDSGRRKFAFLSPIRPEFQEQKFRTVKDILGKQKIRPVYPINSESFSSIEEIESFMFSRPDALDVIFCENDLIAAGVLASIHANRSRFNKEPLVVGCDDTIPMHGVWTISIDIDSIAATAVDAYMRVSRGESSHSKITLKAEPVIRN